MSYEDLTKFIELIKKWRKPCEGSGDDRADCAWDNATNHCADELEEMIKEIEKNKWNNFLK